MTEQQKENFLKAGGFAYVVVALIVAGSLEPRLMNYLPFGLMFSVPIYFSISWVEKKIKGSSQNDE